MVGNTSKFSRQSSGGQGSAERAMAAHLQAEGIDINARNKFYFNNMIFRNNIWNFFKLFKAALIWASASGHTEIVKIFVEQEGIDINAKDEVYFNNLAFQNNIWNFFKLFRTALMIASEKGHT